ncbi:MAG TPA: hypothetical protein VJ505_03735 [Holophagaceae bacterium]|nr:hypothetical protein [Holophagaceae bacterium]
MTPPQTENVGEKVPVKRGRVDSLTIYEITDYELDVLEAGSPSSVFLNFAVALICLAIGGVYSMLTATYKTTTAYLIALLITIVGFIIGGILIFLWYRSNHSITAIVKRIKARVPPDPDCTTGSSDDADQAG